MINEKEFNELELYDKIFKLRKELEKIAHNAIDHHLIKSWYFNGHSFVFIFEEQND